jgi:hypothetical protein
MIHGNHRYPRAKRGTYSVWAETRGASRCSVMTAPVKVTVVIPVLFGLLLFSFSPRHIAVVAIVPDQLLVFVGDVRSESRNPIQDGERARNVSLGPGSF